MQIGRVASTLNCLLQYRSTESTPTKSYRLKGPTDNNLKKQAIRLKKIFICINRTLGNVRNEKENYSGFKIHITNY